MSDKKDDLNDDASNDIIITDLLLKVASMENLLISKGLISREEYEEELNKIGIELAKSILEKSNQSDKIDEFIKNFSRTKKN